MIHSPEHNFLFVSNPKCATHTMYAYLVEHYGGIDLSSSSAYHPVPDVGDFPGAFRWSIVRNPFSRAVAAYFGAIVMEPHCRHWRRVIGSTSFTVFCRWLASDAWRHHTAKAICPQYDLLQLADLAVVIRLENLDSGFASLPFVGPTHPQIPVIAATAYGDWQDWYDADGEAADCICKWAKCDFDEYGYSMDIARSDGVLI